LGRVGGGSGLDDPLRDRTALRVVAVEEHLARLAAADQGQLPPEVVGVLQAGVHPVALGGGARVGGVARKQHPAGSEPFGDPGVAEEASGVPDIHERDAGGVAVEHGACIAFQIGLPRLRP
jgi:hypothetical protein